MYRFLKVIISVLLLGWGPAAFAQGPSYVHYGTEEGLPSNMVYSIITDKRGFLWFATDRGVARFNGISFERFSTFDGLKDNEVFSITEDYAGRIWLNSYNGKLCYFKDGKFHTEDNTPFLKLPFKSESMMATVLKDSNVVFYFSDRMKYVLVKGNKLKVVDVTNRQDTADPLKAVLARDAAGYEQVYQDRVVMKDTSGKTLSTRFFKAGRNYQFFNSEQSQIQLYYNDALYNLNEELLFRLPKLKPAKRQILRILKLGGNNFLCCMDGLLVNGTTWLLDGKQVTCVAQDISGNYWISTLKHGVYKMSKDFTKLREFRNIYNGPLVFAEALPNYLFFITFIDNRLNWVQTNQPKPIIGSIKVGDKPRMMEGLRHDRFFFSYNRSASAITSWILRNGYLSYFNFNSNVWVKNVFTDDEYYNIVYYNGIYRIKHNAAGTLMKGIGTNINMSKACPKIFASVMDSDGYIWCSTVDSIYKFKDGIVYRQPQYKAAFRQMGALGHYLIGVTEENKMLICNNIGNKVYIDTATEVDCIWDKIYRIDSTHAIISTNNYYRLLTVEASEHRPRFSISIIENLFIPQQAELICFNKTDCYFLKNGSVVVVGLEQLLKTPPEPKVYMMSMTTEKGRYSVSAPVYISYKESRNISIRFSPLSFDRSKLKYEFSITKDGTENWGQVSTTELNLFNVDYGTYSVKVRVTGLTGRPAYDEFTLVVARPFWAKWWFVAICCLAIVACMILVIWLISARILKKRKKKFEAEIKYQTSEFKALNALMNPHFIFNSLNNIQGLINDGNKEAANQYLTIFSQLVRQNMHNISKELISVEREMILVTNYLHLERLRFKTHLNFFIDIEDGIDLQDIFIPPLLIQPIVENAVKHGILPQQSEESYVHIRLREEEDELRIEVEDNGVGISYAQQHKNTLHESTGIANIRKRIEHLKAIHNQDITLSIEDIVDASGKVAGTLAIIRISIAIH